MAKNNPGGIGWAHSWLQPLYNFLRDGVWTVLYAGGDSSQGYSYAGGKATWLDIDSVNPPTVAALRFVDQVTGDMQVVTVESGLLVVTPGP